MIGQSVHFPTCIFASFFALFVCSFCSGWTRSLEFYRLSLLEIKVCKTKGYHVLVYYLPEQACSNICSGIASNYWKLQPTWNTVLSTSLLVIYDWYSGIAMTFRILSEKVVDPFSGLHLMCLKLKRFPPSAWKLLFVAHVVQQLKARLRRTKQAGNRLIVRTCESLTIGNTPNEHLVPNHGGSPIQTWTFHMSRVT